MSLLPPSDSDKRTAPPSRQPSQKSSDGSNQDPSDGTPPTVPDAVQPEQSDRTDAEHDNELPAWRGRWTRFFGRWINEDQCEDLVNRTAVLKEHLEECLSLLADLDSLDPAEQRRHKALLSIGHIRVYETFQRYNDHSLPSPWKFLPLSNGIDPMGEFRVLRNHFAHSYRVPGSTECSYSGNKWSFLKEQYPDALLCVDRFLKEVTRLHSDKDVWKVNPAAETGPEEKGEDEEPKGDSAEPGWDEGNNPVRSDVQLWPDEENSTPSDGSCSFSQKGSKSRWGLLVPRHIKAKLKRKTTPDDDSTGKDNYSFIGSASIRSLHSAYIRFDRVERYCNKFAKTITGWQKEKKWTPEWGQVPDEAPSPPSGEETKKSSRESAKERVNSEPDW